MKTLTEYLQDISIDEIIVNPFIHKERKILIKNWEILADERPKEVIILTPLFYKQHQFKFPSSGNTEVKSTLYFLFSTKDYQNINYQSTDFLGISLLQSSFEILQYFPNDDEELSSALLWFNSLNLEIREDLTRTYFKMFSFKQFNEFNVSNSLTKNHIFQIYIKEGLKNFLVSEDLKYSYSICKFKTESENER